MKRAALFVALAIVFVPGIQAQEAASQAASSDASAVASDAPPSATGVGEVLRIANELQRASEDIRRLQARIPDWAGVSAYASENEKLGPAHPNQNRVIFLGDSITHNWGSAKYSNYFQREHSGFIPVNRGIGGQNVAQMLLRMRPDVLDLQPKAMVLFAGTNDLPTFKVPNLMKFVEDNFTSIFDLAESHGVQVIVCSILPVNDFYKNRTVTRPPESILELNSWLRQQAQSRQMQYVDFYSALTDGHDRLKKDLSLDGLHPTSAGYAPMEALLDAAIDRSLQSKETLKPLAQTQGRGKR